MKDLFMILKIIFLWGLFATMAHAALMNPQGGPPLLAWDEPDVRILPINFRTTNLSISLQPGTFFSLHGLTELHASGSGQFSLISLKNALPKMSGEIWVVNLRQESHGFIDGKPFTWYAYENRGNEGQFGEGVEKRERDALAALRRQPHLTLYRITKKNAGRIEEATPEKINWSKIESEREIVEGLKLHYMRFYIQDRYPPDHFEADRFIAWVNTLPAHAWVHFHCRAGRGRTTTFLVMYDILKNARHIQLEDIIKRHALIGPKDISKIDEEGPEWKRVAAKKRIEFITAFYQYAKDPNGYPSKKWSEWNTT